MKITKKIKKGKKVVVPVAKPKSLKRNLELKTSPNSLIGVFSDLDDDQKLLAKEIRFGGIPKLNFKKIKNKDLCGYLLG